jgi:quercetin dioxygenase-like cupin family protein
LNSKGKGEEMKITDYRKVKAEDVGDPEAKGVTIRWLISEKEGAPHFAMRLFELQPGGHTPYHKHSWEHEVFLLKGEGALVGEGETHIIREGDAIFVPGEENHQFRNTSEETMTFLCMVPI